MPQIIKEDSVLGATINNIDLREPLDEDLKNLNGITIGMLALLANENIVSLTDFADLASDELTGGYDIVKGERVKIKGYLEDFALSKNEADELIMSARKKIYKD